MSTVAGPSLPTAKTIQVDTRGAMILDEESPEVRPFPFPRAAFR